MAEEDALRMITLRNNFYRDNYRRVVLGFLIAIIANIFLVIALGWSMSHKPEPRYFATTSDGRIVPLYPLTQPVVSQTALLQWANEAAISSFSFDYVSYRKNLQKASEYYTPDGWKSFENALKESGNLETVIAKHLVVTAVATGAPTIIDQSVISGRYAWKIQMPLLVTYESGAQIMRQPMVVTMVVTRVSTLNTPKGIAIAQFYGTPGQAQGTTS